jgi:hypothetical protein
VTLIYVGTGSCAGVAAIKDQTNLDPAIVGNYYTVATGAASPCTVAVGQKADVAISDVFYETCGFGARPAAVGDFSGPAQAMLIVVPGTASSAVPSSITAEEAADVWGCGALGQVSPWLVDNNIQQRNAASGTQNIIARAINVLASSFKGKQNGSTGALATSLGTVTPADTGIGFVAADYFDTHTGLKSLAFRGIDQTKAYYANSTPDSFDKRNVRDGHYLAWGYEHLLVRVDTTGKATTQKAQNFVDWVLASTTTTENAPNFDPVTVESAAHVIPLCAMKVKRSSDGGLLSSYTPADTCNCAFEAAANGAPPTSCIACTDDAPCTPSSTHCHHGYCE